MATLLTTRYTYYQRSGTNYPWTGTWPDQVTDHRFYFQVYLDTQSTANNTSSIYVKRYLQIQNTFAVSSANFNTGNSINGGSYSSSSSTKNYQTGTYLLGTDYYTINHNSDGTGSFTYRGRGTGLDFGYNYTTIITLNLPTIPRFANINSFSASVQNPNQISVSWATSASCDLIRYSTNGGTSYSTASGQSGTSGTFTISGLTPSTTYNLRIKVRRTDSQLETESSTLSRTTHKLSTMTSTRSFNLGSDLPITIDRQDSTYTHTIQFSVRKDSTSSWTAIKNLTGVGSSTTMSLSSAELSYIYNLIPNQNTAQTKFEIFTITSGITYGSTVPTSGTATVVNSNPTFTTWTYADTNATTLALTGSNQKIIKGYSNVKATITSANKMVANKGAIETSYQLTIGTKPSATVAYSSSATVEMTVNAVDNNVFNCYAIDSRGNSTKVTKTITTDYINYTPISITSASASRTDNIGTETTLAFSGNIFDGSFGSVSNSVKTATYKFKKTTDSSYTDGTSVITPTKTGDTFSFSGTIKGDEGSGGVDGFDATYSYNIQVIVTDELSTKTFTFLLGSGTPNIAISQNGVAINQAYDETLGGALQVNGDVNIDGVATFKANQFFSGENKAIDLKNSDIIGANAIVMNDEAQVDEEGILFLKEGANSGSTNATDYETLRGYRGDVFYNGNYMYLFKGNLPSGDGTNSYWQSIPAGIYWVGTGTTISGGSGKPANYGIVQIIKSGSEIYVVWNAQATGPTFTMSMNANTALTEYSWAVIQGAVTLYNNSTGTNGNITLNANASIFSYIEIFFRTNDNVYDSVKVYGPHGKTVSLTTSYVNATYTYIKTSLYSISNTTMTVGRGAEARIGNSVATTRTTPNNLYIVRVVGYR